jgi:hypothetical protein
LEANIAHIDRPGGPAYLAGVDAVIADRSTYGLAAGALMVFALIGLGEIGDDAESTQSVTVAELREADESPPVDPEYPDARALVLAVAALLEAQ